MHIRAYLDQHRKYKNQLQNLQKASLMGGGVSTGPTFGGPAPGEESLEVLKKARQQLHETEQVGLETLEHLGKQREVILNATQNAKEVNSNLATSNRLLTRMGKWWRG
eukprot:g48140.t1